MTSHIFLTGLLVVSTLTGLTTEGVKKWLQERNKKYYANALAGYVSIGWSVLVTVGYTILTETAFDIKMGVYLVALMILSWLSAMCGYDKVIQAIAQFKSTK